MTRSERNSGTFLVAILLGLAFALPAQAQTWTWPPEDEQIGAAPAGQGDDVQGLVDELRQLIDEAERRRSADPRFLDRLRQLADRYSWPWQVSVFSDAFRDGNYSRDPSWQVAAGDFWIDRDFGLRTVHTPRTAAAGGRTGDDRTDPAAQILGTVLEQILRQQGGNGGNGGNGGGLAAPAIPEIFLDRGFANAFAVEMRLYVLENGGQGGLLLGPYQGQQRSTGYYVAVRPGGDRGTVELLRQRGGGASVIAREDVGFDANGRVAEHRILWTRAADGGMTVSIDGERVIDTVDRGISGGFDGFRILNQGGSYGVRFVAVDTVAAN